MRGKLGMWQALDVVAAGDARLSGFDFKHLAAEAEAQYEKVEQQRLQAATIALAGKRT